MSETIKCRYLGDLRVENTHVQSGTHLITDAPVDNRGKGQSFSPTDLLAASLGSCIMTIMGIKAMDKGIDIEGTEVNVTKIMAEDPRRVAEVVVEFFFPDKGYTDGEKELLESLAGVSPVPLSLSSELKQTVRFHWAK
ncbi:MAG: OsmC family protein [Marinilabilia sp.]